MALIKEYLSRAPSIPLLQVGWKHQQTMKELEDKRKVKSTAFFEAKRRMLALRSKAIAQVEAGKA